MPVRRTADPISVQHVWDGIRSANLHRQMADLPRITKYLQKLDSCTQAQAELYVKQTVDDGLVVAVNKVVSKGSSTGNQVESYRIPTQELNIPKDDGKDWYCIECHLAGDVTPCGRCFRVFHSECSTKARQKLDGFKSKMNIKFNPKKSQENGDVSKEEKQNNSEQEPSKSEILNDSDALENLLSKTADDEAIDCDVNSPMNNGGGKELQKLTDSSSVISDLDDSIYDESLCSLCNLAKIDLNCPLNKDELNHLMSFILTRIRSWLPENLTKTMAPDSAPEWMTDTECSWRANQLFYQAMDMGIMELKLQAQEYSELCEFFSDVITIQHNVAVFHGIESQEFAAADFMIQDCLHDMNELVNCPDCYKHSNEKVNSKWFCFPCRNPHKLVWAKQKGYPYWPAKVMRETYTNFDVRFFGGKYERSVLPKNYIKPIKTDMNTLQIKKSPAFNKAYQELVLHQKLLSDPHELNKILTTSKPKKNVKARQSLPNIPAKTSNKVPKRKRASVNLPKDVYEFADKFDEDEESETPPVKRKPASKLNKKKTSKVAKKNSGARKTQSERHTRANQSDVINISDGEENEYKFPQDDYQFGTSFDNGYEQVTSSTEYFRVDDSFNGRDNSENSMHQLDQPYCDAVEKTRRKLETCRDKNQLIKVAMDCMQSEIDKITNDHNDHLKKLFDSHNAQISETKKKQWCYNCEQDAIYHCCWNTAYCSPTCQQQHWQAEHKKVCRRKR